MFVTDVTSLSLIEQGLFVAHQRLGVGVAERLVGDLYHTIYLGRSDTEVQPEWPWSFNWLQETAPCIRPLEVIEHTLTGHTGTPGAQQHFLATAAKLFLAVLGMKDTSGQVFICPSESVVNG